VPEPLWSFFDGAPLAPVHPCGIPHKPLDLLEPWLVDGILNFSSICAESAPAHQTSIQCSLSCRLTNFFYYQESFMSLGTILLIVLILMLIGAIPSWSHSRNWGYGPSGGLGLIVIIVVVLLLMGRI
jgi:hypothetical protein